MATEHPGTNGNYSSQTQSLYTNEITATATQMPNGNTANSNMDYSSGVDATSGGGNASASASEVPKDEVGWYFVEQYYTTLSKNPEKLHVRHVMGLFLQDVGTDSHCAALLQQDISIRLWFGNGKIVRLRRSEGKTSSISTHSNALH